MDIVLVHPEIPHNSGCAARLAAAVGLRLHLVEPLGFSLEDRYLKRAGLDYWPAVELVVHRDWATAERALAAESARPLDERLRCFTARGGRSLFATTSRPTTCSSSAASRAVCPRSSSRPAPSGACTSRSGPACAASTWPTRSRSRPTRAWCAPGVPLPANDGAYAPDARSDEDVWPVHVARRAAPR
jgi:hypothetical protein